MISDFRQSPAPSSPPKNGSTPRAQEQIQNYADHLVTSRGSDQPVTLGRLLAATAPEAKSLESKLSEHIEGEVLVRLKSGDVSTGMADFADTYGAKLIEKIDNPLTSRGTSNDGLLHLQLPQGMSTAQGITVMNKDPRVKYAVTNDVIRLHEPAPSKIQAKDDPQGRSGENLPSDLSPKLWGMKNLNNPGVDIHAGGAWTINTGSRSGPVVAVVDTGIDYNHKTLKNNVWTDPNGGTHGFNAITGRMDPLDDHYHGTHCSGTIGGNGDTGVYGVNQKAQIMGVKFLNNSGSGQLADAIKGIIFAEDHGARIMSNSWGGGPFNQALHDTIASTKALQIFAAGNDSSDNDSKPSYPAAYHTDNMLTVAATDNHDQLASFSNYGAKSVDLAAPGVGIWSTSPGDAFRYLDGTSMATPHVAGAATLIATEFPGISNDEIKARILYNVDDVPALHGKVASGGRLNLAAAMRHDTVPPGAPGNLVATDVKAGRLTLNWIAGGDDGASGGKAAVYELRYSDRPIVEGAAGPGQVSFSDARTLSTDRPSSAGTKEKLSVGVPLTSQDKTYYFAMRAIDHVGLKSGLSTLSALVPAAKVAFVDDKNPDNWIPDGKWGQIDDSSRGRVWTDSPDGDYDNNANTALTSKPISLAGLSGCRLNFDEKHATELKYDKVFLEATTDGKNWNGLTSYTGSADWNSQSVDLSAYDGKSVQVRFRLNSDASTTGDGIYLDNMVIAGS